MVDFKTLVQGAKVVGVIILAFIGVFAIAILGGIVVGVLVHVVVPDPTNVSVVGDITVSSAMMTALAGYETTYISTVSTGLSPLATIAALVIVVVLILIFFGRKGFSLGKGVN